VFGVSQSSQKMNFVDKMIALAKTGKDLKVVNDQIMSPTYSLDLAVKIEELIKKSAPLGLYHITNQGSCSWYELAKNRLDKKLLYTHEKKKRYSLSKKKKCAA
jgi:dTDP-4-dehydrorhamnose reductase